MAREGWKVCNWCEKEKPWGEFYRHTAKTAHKGDSQGFYGRCKSCMDALHKLWRERRKELMRKAWQAVAARRTPEQKAKRAAAERVRRAKEAV